MMRKMLTAAGLMVAMVLSTFGGAVSAQGNSNADLNHPEYYEGLGHGTCTKTDNPSDPYELGAPPAGSYWSLLVLKAGSAASNDDWNTQVSNPAPGQYVHPSGKRISHVIRCHKPGSPPSSTSTTSTTVPGEDCNGYTPTQVAIDPPTASPGDPITITGVAVKDDEVTATLSGGSMSPVPLGSGVADENGNFTINAILPANLAPGTYTVTLSSTDCANSVDVDIIVYPLAFSGCGFNNAGRTFFPGQSVVWTFHDSSFDTSQDVELDLVRTSYSADLYGPAPWPGSNQVEVMIPLTAPAGKYSMVQVGTKKNGKTQTKTCPIWIDPPPELASAAQPTSVETAGAQLPVVALLIGAVSVFSLVQLRLRRRS